MHGWLANLMKLPSIGLFLLNEELLSSGLKQYLCDSEIFEWKVKIFLTQCLSCQISNLQAVIICRGFASSGFNFNSFATDCCSRMENFEGKALSCWKGRELLGEQPPGICWISVKVRCDLRQGAWGHRWHLSAPENTHCLLGEVIHSLPRAGKACSPAVLVDFFLLCCIWRRDLAPVSFGAV